MPGYLSDDYHAFAVASNVEMAGAKAVDTSYPVQLLSPKAAPESDGPIWAARCSAGPQTVHFTRNVWLPGPPNYAGSFTYGTDVGQHELGSLTSLDLIVNGTAVLHEPLRAYVAGTVGSTQRVALSPAAVNAFRYQYNTIEVRVHRRATRGGCNHADPATRVGVSFLLTGQFQTDLAVNPPTPDIYMRLAPGQSFTEGITANFHNLGPNWEPTGTYRLTVTGTPTFVLGTGNGPFPGPAPPLTSCQQVDNGLSHIVTCSLGDFAPGADGKLGSVFQVTAPSSDYTDFTVAYSDDIEAGAVADLNSADNTKTTLFVFCGTQSTKPGCQTAS